MTEDYYVFLCQSLAKATSAGVRLYHNSTLCNYFSVYPLSPDPVSPFLPELLAKEHSAGVITTLLFQFYGFLTLEPEWRVIIGPTKTEQNDERLLDEQLFLIGVTQEHKSEYLRALFCAPIISVERMGWLIVFLSSLAQKRQFALEDLYVNVQSTKHSQDIQIQKLLQAADNCDDSEARELVERSYEFEKLLLSFVEYGEPEKLEDMFNALPNMTQGRMASDTLRQIKNTSICAATVASRAAIAGGMDSNAAFRLSDLYIQKTELLSDLPSLSHLRNDIFLDYARQVKQIRHNIISPDDSQKKHLFLQCADYISKNIYNPIRAQELADALGYSRTYLCHQFKSQTGLTLTQYVLQEKILEAQRMLEFTDKTLTEISVLFSFSSQSHFQTVFKQICGQTPLGYRQSKRGTAKLHQI